jgi:hypothetical protein
MSFPVPTPDDERNHEPNDDPLWSESYYMDFVGHDGNLGGYVRIGKYPNLGVVWYWACVVGPDRPLVTVIDHTVPLPSTLLSLELRHDGLWADHHVETPFEHFSLGLEAFGVALDDPAQVYGDALGERTPLGFDLEWETDGRVFRYPQGMDRYEIPCRVHGEILVGDETIAFDGNGQRDHSWGQRDWWSMGWCWTAFRMDDGTRFHGVTVKPSIGFAIGYEQAPGAGEPGEDMALITTFDADETLGDAGIPTSAVLTMNQRQFAVSPIAWSPVHLESPAGAFSRFPRAAARFTELGGDDDGRTGLGWIEFNQPPAPA